MFDKKGFIEALREDKAFLNDVINELGGDIISQASIVIYSENGLDESDFQIEFKECLAKDYFDIFRTEVSQGINFHFENILKRIDKSQNKRTSSSQKIFRELAIESIANPPPEFSSMDYLKFTNTMFSNLGKKIKDELKEHSEKTLYDVLEDLQANKDKI